MSLGLTVNKKKNGMLLEYIARSIPGVNLRKLLKLLYLIDEKSMQQRCIPVTWFDYFAWAKGPVAPEVYNIKQGEFKEFVSCVRNADGKFIVLPVSSDADKPESAFMDLFSPYELNIIDSIIKQYGDRSADELTELTHEHDSLWARTVKSHHIKFDKAKTSDVPVLLQEINGDNEERASIYEDALWNMKFQEHLDRHA